MDAPAETETAEVERVYRWRLRRFGELGFDRGQAQRLALAGADWHQAQRLIASGCPVELAYELLR